MRPARSLEPGWAASARPSNGGTPAPSRQLHVGATKVLAEMDAELLAGLEAAGFNLDFGEDGSGLFMKYLTRGGGYVFGCR